MANEPVLTAFSLERVSFEEAELEQIVAPKFSPLLLVLRPSELLIRQLIEEVFCVLEEQDLELKSLVTFFSVSARDFDLDFRRVPTTKDKCQLKMFQKIVSLAFGKSESLSNKNIQLNGLSFQRKDKQTELIKHTFTGAISARSRRFNARMSTVSSRLFFLLLLCFSRSLCWRHRHRFLSLCWHFCTLDMSAIRLY